MDSAAEWVAEDVWRVTTPLPYRPREVHAYLVGLGDGRFALVDGGADTDAAWAALECGVRVVTDWRSVAVNVVTHMHVDHVGLCERVRGTSGARLVMGALDAERRMHAAANPAEEAAYREELFRRCGAPAAWLAEVVSAGTAAPQPSTTTPVDVALAGARGELPEMPGWTWVWTPGHTAGHVALFRGADRTLIAGDAVLPRITPTVGVNRQRADPVADYLAGLERLAALAPGCILPGHGDPLTNAARIDALRVECEEEGSRVRALLDAHPATVWEVVSRRFPERAMSPPTRMLALRESLAHLRHQVRVGGAIETSGADAEYLFVAAGS